MFQKIAKHRANDASNDVHRPPLHQVGLFEVGLPDIYHISFPQIEDCSEGKAKGTGSSAKANYDPAVRRRVRE